MDLNSWILFHQTNRMMTEQAVSNALQRHANRYQFEPYHILVAESFILGGLAAFYPVRWSLQILAWTDIHLLHFSGWHPLFRILIYAVCAGVPAVAAFVASIRVYGFLHMHERIGPITCTLISLAYATLAGYLFFQWTHQDAIWGGAAAVITFSIMFLLRRTALQSLD